MKCDKKNHFAKQCCSKNNRQQNRQNKGRKPALHPLDHDICSQNSEPDYLYGNHAASTSSPRVNITACGHTFKMLVDTGATINVIDQNTFSQMRNVKLQNTKTKAFAYDSKTPVEVAGKFDTMLETKKHITIATIYVVKGSRHSGNLMSLETAKELGLISLHLNHVTTKDSTLDIILHKHNKVFDGLGKLKDTKVTLSINSSKTPKVQP